MAKLTGSVGKKGENDAADVKQVQQLLAKFADMPDAKALDIKADGKCGKGKLEVAGKGGKKVSIGSPNNGADNDDLHKLGADYGVIKLATDPPHWSTDGH
jgi:hypothetical protein